MGQNKFEAYVGIANGYIASKSVTIASDILEKIKIKYPDLNLEWLVTGKDEMLRQPSEQGAQSSGHDDYKEKYFHLLEQHTVLQDKYAALLEEREKKSYATHRGGAAGVAAAGG